MKQNKNLGLFTTLLFLMLIYIGWVFYLSEPTYIDNCYKSVEKYDYISVSRYSHSWNEQSGTFEVENGIVLQVDSTKAIIKVNSWNEFQEIDLKQHKFRIIGKGTLYHKINNYVGMNIMMITQILIGAISVVLLTTLFLNLNKILNR